MSQRPVIPTNAEIVACACGGHTRAQMLRRAAAAAVPGAGLPAIEPGMPTPAGTGMSRRSFLSRSAGFGLAVYGAGKLGFDAFEAGIATAAEAPDQPVLVTVFLDGGADALSMLAPTGAPHAARYAQLRPTLALGLGENGGAELGPAFSEDPSLIWHSSLSPLATLHAEGKVSVLPAVGYGDANQSHFTSRHFWEVGATDPFGRYGWMGRYLDQHGTNDNPLQGLSLGYDLSPALATQSVPVAAMSRPEEYDFGAPGVWGPVEAKMLDAIGDLGAPPTDDPGLAEARAAAAATGRLRAQVAPFQGGYTTPPGVGYPAGSSFSDRLRALAAMLGAGLPLRCVAINGAGGYDTHSNQEDSLPQNLSVTAGSLLAFQRDLEARGLDDRVLTLVWSEFGRRPRENGSGTDHGAAGSAFLIGSAARGTMIGEFPGIGANDLDEDDNLRATADFRGVYRGLLEQWLSVDAAAIIPNAGNFAAPALLKP
jgi:uncharacterized protein (DUF1501 family)